MVSTDIAYIAGFFDGEGCIGNTRWGMPRIAISQKDKEVLEWIQQYYYGGIYHRPSNDTYVLHICRKGVVQKFLTDMYPYLRVKKKQARLAYAMTQVSVERRLPQVKRLQEMKHVHSDR